MAFDVFVVMVASCEEGFVLVAEIEVVNCLDEVNEHDRGRSGWLCIYDGDLVSGVTWSGYRQCGHSFALHLSCEALRGSQV